MFPKSFFRQCCRLEALLLCISLAYTSKQLNAQTFQIVKTVGSSVLEPDNKSQVAWQNNAWNGKFFYQGKGSPLKLCVTDGTSAGTLYLKDLGTATSLNACVPAEHHIYLVTSVFTSFSPITIQYQLWKSDGSVNGTELLYTFDGSSTTNACNFLSDPQSYFNYSVKGDSLFFNGYSIANGNELWVTDGSAAGTKMIKDINTNGTAGSKPYAFCRMGNYVYFSAAASGVERKLWKTDGTAAGTVQVDVPEPFFMTAGGCGKVGNKMIFYATDNSNGVEPWVSDGTGSGTFMLEDINASGNSLISPVQNADLYGNDSYCFLVLNNGSATGLYRTDGTSNGTIQLTSNAQNAKSGVSGGPYTAWKGNDFWMIEYINGGANEKLYRTDGTQAGTSLVHSNVSYAQNLFIYQGSLWFQSRDIGSPANVEPWKSEGLEANTVKAGEISPGAGSSNPFGFFEMGGQLYFFAQAGNAATISLYRLQGNPVFTFTPTVAGNLWSNAANWSTGSVPTANDQVVIPAGLTVNITGGGNAMAGALTMGAGATVQFANANDTLQVNKALINQGTNIYAGPGTLLLQGTINPIVVTGGFTVGHLLIRGNVSLPPDPIYIKP